MSTTTASFSEIVAETASADAVADIVLDGFDKHFSVYRRHTTLARAYFEQCQWQKLRESVRGRIDFYDTRVSETVARLSAYPLLHERLLDSDGQALWRKVKRAYVQRLLSHQQPELAETFYNSVFCRLYHYDYYCNDLIFVRRIVSAEHIDSGESIIGAYYPRETGFRNAIAQMLLDVPLSVPYEDLQRDVRYIVECLSRYLSAGQRRAQLNFQINIVRSLFYRNKAAYLVGKASNGEDEIPFILPILHTRDRGLWVDAILFEASEIATVFSFAHAYFLVDTPVPAALVEFLRSVIPMRSEAELYSAIGFHKQGKTSFYRQLLHHLRNSTDQFESAPGVRGMVMSVFTLPSFPYVFKVIRDRAQPPKTTTRSVVIQKYHLVKHHDRAGRMADTWEFSNVALPRARFSKALLEQLDQSCRSGIELRDDSVVIRHVYIERRMTPLDLYLSNATEKEADDIVYDYGEAIKQLAANNIFPGDMWLKNFGVTRTGRVVFYDYDEIVYLTECNFRRLPEMPDDLAALPMNDWFPVGADDVYPEEFAKFLCAHPRVACRLPQHHDDLMLPEYWQSVQQRVHAGRLPDLYPYPLERRFRRSRL